MPLNDEQRIRANALMERLFGPGPHLVDPVVNNAVQQIIVDGIEGGATDTQILSTVINDYPALAQAGLDAADQRAEERAQLPQGDGPLIGQSPSGFNFPRDPSAGGGEDPNVEFIASLLEGGYVPVPGQDGVFFNPHTGDTVDFNNVNVGGGGSGSALGFAQLAESQRQFDASFAQGQREFELRFGLDAKRLGLDEREYAARRDEFAQNFAENQRQFDAQQGLAQSRFGLEQELGRANLQLNQQRFGLEKQQAEAAQRLRESEFTRDVLRNPSDFIFAAFESRGAQAPRDRVTHADLINQLQAQPFQPAPSPGAIPGLEHGGSSGSNVILTGENGPELVFDNPDGTVEVVPVDQSGKGQSRFGIPGAQDGGTFGDPRAVQGSQDPEDIFDFLSRSDAPSSVTIGDRAFSLGGNGSLRFDALEQSNLGPRFGGNIDIAGIRRSRALGEEIATGGGGSRFGGVNQRDIIERALRFSPPAVSAAVSGNRIPNYQLATDLTLGSLQGLNDSELAALATRLGVVNNRSLADEVFELQRRYGPTGQRSARFG